MEEIKGLQADVTDMRHDMKDMQHTIIDVQQRVTYIEAVLPTLATKAELSDMKAELIKWIVGTAIGLGIAGITVMTFVLNNAVPKMSQQPIIITLPAGAGVKSGS
jgi:uncharacterized protein (DUF39 family)